MEQLVMEPAAGERRVRFVGDRVRIELTFADRRAVPPGWQARVRTNLGRAEVLRGEILEAQFHQLPLAGASWRDLPLRADAAGWWLELPLAEVGFFQAKPYALDPAGRQHWPWGDNFGVTVHPDDARTANTIYCAFTRLFGPAKSAPAPREDATEARLKQLDAQGYTVIPPSGKLRDVLRQLPHILDTLGCRVLHLLPVNPTPTTYARFGRFGSPYAGEDLLAIDPALVEFDQRTTGVEQFRELTYAVHARGARVVLDFVINHTGWGSVLQERHPEWFKRGADGRFASPGAWGVTWEDLVELEQHDPKLWQHLAGVFLEWCRRGVDGFRCDAGYQVPLPAWQYIIARVRQEFPETIFLLEGLGGAWETTARLLTDGGMQWAYSELFQNYSGLQVGGYLDHSLAQSERAGLLVHYSETHDNARLAARSRAWSLLRNRLSALASTCGGFGFTCGVEWLATEKINVHQCAGLAWGAAENLVPELARLNQLLAEHPCFFDGAACNRLSAVAAPVFVLRRDSAEGADHVLVLVNTDDQVAQTVELEPPALAGLEPFAIDLLAQPLPTMQRTDRGSVLFQLAPGACHCLAARATPAGLAGEAYRRARAQGAWGLTALSRVLPVEQIGAYDWRQLADRVAAGPRDFLAAINGLAQAGGPADLFAALDAIPAAEIFPAVVPWRLPDRRRVTLVPPGHWLLLEDDAPFRATLTTSEDRHPQHVRSIAMCAGHVACFRQDPFTGDAALTVERYATESPHVTATIRFLAARPEFSPRVEPPPAGALALLTNGRGGMARLGVDLGAVQSKYDCLLGANLHPSLPVDRHILAKRVRVWVNADGFITALNAACLVAFDAGPPARWHFVANAGDGRTVALELTANLCADRNTTVLHFHRPVAKPARGRPLADACDVRLTVRVDLEDRNFHAETKRNGGAEVHFAQHTRPLAGRAGFEFTPAADRRLRVVADAGAYHPEAEWCENLPHPVEQSRGQVGSGDAFSPGWFELPLTKGATAQLIVSADDTEPDATEIAMALSPRTGAELAKIFPADDSFGRQLERAVRAFVVRRDREVSVIAGYPWFLDWGRDSLICARGLLAAGLVTEVEQLLVAFGRFVEHGTLPNTIHGADASNRDTSDAPLWYGVVCEEVAAVAGREIYQIPVGTGGDTIGDVLEKIATGYRDGTPNGIGVDAASGLVWSPPHFTWMDTNYPAGTPREGYPVEIQVLWIRLLRQLEQLGRPTGREGWRTLAKRAQKSLEEFFWLEERGYLADVLLAPRGQPAAGATVDHALRSNQLLAVSLGLVTGERARRSVAAALQHLVVPGALRSLAPLPAVPPLPIRGADGRLLNNPAEPYWGRYEGDEDTRRKPAYHNGTAWTWTFPIFCEALAAAWEFSPPAVAAARAYLGSMDRLLADGCLGQLPEIIDGDAPHQARGCDAQAWGATEALRVWVRLQKP